MFRKTMIALAATATIATVALPTAASAHKWHGHHGYRIGAIGFGLGLAGAGLAANCFGYEWVQTRRGYWRQVLVNYCAD